MASNQRESPELKELKQKAAQFYTENGVPQKMEEILNSLFYDNPQDVYGYVASYFDSFSNKPVISKVKSIQALDSKGQTAIHTEIFCTVKNKEKLVASHTSGNESHPHDGVKQEDRDAAEQERQNFVTAAINIINSNITEALSGVNPRDQQQVDDLLLNVFNKLRSDEEDREKESQDGVEGAATEAPVQSPKPASESPSKAKGTKSPKGKGKGPAVVIVPDEPRENFLCGCNAISAVSQAVCEAAAAIQSEPVYKHVATLKSLQVSEPLSVPLPMVTIFASGKCAPGKLNCIKELCIIPRPEMPLSESIKHIAEIHKHCVRSVSSKAGATGLPTSDYGAVWAPFDRPEQALDLLQEAVAQRGLTVGEDFHMAINCAGHEIFDYDKGKYEVTTGQLKAAEDLAEYWADLLARYPAVIALIDPMRRQEKEAWTKLCERVSEQCYVIGDHVLPRPGLLKAHGKPEDCPTSGAILRLEQADSVSDVMAASKLMEDAGNQIIIGCGTAESPGGFLADLAVGCQARFLKVGAPCRGERVVKLNRLAVIEAALGAAGRLGTLPPHAFPSLKPPSPTPTPPDGDGDQGPGQDGEAENAG